ncbi:fungal-specific transcription factor domain-containing protein [Tricladium varicosporioides]|nr:fungal-specific transcription factor domain-containing protein [Hymenoscyphus varicosporioides]
MDEVNSKRRRGLGAVTANACTECRKKRAKCDGEVPCGRCSSQKGVECHYEIPIRQSKENMRAEIEDLRKKQRHSERILAALASDDRTEQVLTHLRNGEKIESITEQLETSNHTVDNEPRTTIIKRYSEHRAIDNAIAPARRAEALAKHPEISKRELKDESPGIIWPGRQYMNHIPSISSEGHGDDMMSWQPDHAQPDHHESASTTDSWHRGSVACQSTSESATLPARGRGQEKILGPKFGHQKDNDTPNFSGIWTTVTSDKAFVEHLMTLYFCWEYPTFASLSKEHFLEDFEAGNPRHCSPLLVNSILALGCRFSSQPKARANPDDSDTAGDHFFAEALRLLDSQIDRHQLTTIQALGLMSIREASCGRPSESLFLSGQSIRLAIEMGLHKDHKESESEQAQIEHAVRSATFWGAFSLDQAWSLSIGRLPHFSQEMKLVTKPAIIEHVEATDWVPYTDDGHLPDPSCQQPSNVRSVFKTFCELSEIVHRSLYTVYRPGGILTSKKLIQRYTEYLQWYESIPTTLRLGFNFTPAVLFAHMYYHFAILLLFRPFIKLDLIGSGVSPRDVCNQAANAISALVNSYSQLYTLHRTPSFVPYFVLTSCITHIVTFGSLNQDLDRLAQGINDLKEMRGGHGFATKALDIIHYLIGYWQIKGSPDDDDDEGKLKDYKRLCRPETTSMNQFCPNIQSVDIINGIGPVNIGENPLFWPFPLQGRPILDVAVDKLEEAGFKILEDHRRSQEVRR